MISTCAYRLCDNEFESRIWGGNPKRFCCDKCRKAEGRLLRIELKSKANERNRAVRTKAQTFASFHCVKYRTCLDTASRNGSVMYCLDCGDCEMVENAFRDELEPEIVDSEGEHHICL